MILFCYRSAINAYNTPQQVIIALPSEARVPAVRLGWWQRAEMQTGAFAIDNVLIGPSMYDFGSTYSDTYVIIYYHVNDVITVLLPIQV